MISLKVIQWGTYHKDNEVRSESVTTDDSDETSIRVMTEWQEEFLKVDTGTLFELILVSE